MADFPFLFALGWIEIVIFIVVFVIPLISQLLGGGEEAKEARRRQQQPRRQPQPEPLHDAPQRHAPQQQVPQQQVPQQQVPQQGGGRGALEAEIEEFLRRAQGSKRHQPPEKKVEPQIEKPAAKPRSPVQPRLIDSDTQTAPRERELGRGVADHVRDHIQSAPISEHAARLGRDVAQADEKLEGHIHSVFDHQLGKLAKQPTQEAPAQGTDAAVWESSVERRERREAAQQSRAADIAKMLRDPDSMQQAIILSEILRRPE